MASSSPPGRHHTSGTLAGLLGRTQLSEFSHAGGVVVRSDAGVHRFLLVQSSRNPSHWVLPKGHIDPGETPEAAAVREVREEAGVVGEIVSELGVDTYSLPGSPAHSLRGEEVRTLYFLMRFAGEVPADEDRALRWLDLEEARRTLSFEGSRALLERAAVEYPLARLAR